MKTVKELENEGKYVYRYKHIGFQDGNSSGAPQRIDDEIDQWDIIFESKKDFDIWFKDTQIGLAELDEVMNYCKYFVRTDGNDGEYVRDGKKHKVNGLWDGYHIKGTALFPYIGFDYELIASFRMFLQENQWVDNWFELMDRYK